MMKKFAFVTVLIVSVMSFVCLSAAQRAQATLSDKAQAGSIGPGRVVEVPSSDVSYAPTAAEIAAHEQLLAAKSRHLAPALGPHTTAADVARPGGPATDVSVQQASPLAATTFTVFKKSLINSICPNCAESIVNEPSAANSGGRVVETSNWNIAYSVNGGTTFLNQNPYTLSPGYCCDTQVVYDKTRDVFILMLLDYNGEGASTNGITLSVVRGFFPSTGPAWCTYKFTGGNFGEGSTDTLDFPKIGLSNSNLFLTWNDYPPNSRFAASGLARLPLDALASCAGFNYSFLLRNTEFTFALAQQVGVHDQFYWVSNWMLDGTINGQNLRIFWWPDNLNSYFGVTRGINAYTFGNAACGSPNWCSRLDPRSESVVITPAEFRAQANGAFAGDQILEVAATAGPSGFSNGNNYVVYNYFKLNSLAYIGNDQTYNTSETFAYPGCAVNERGYVGCALSQGLNAPGGLVILQDNVNPTQPWGVNFVVGGSGGASAWGDYSITNPWQPGSGPFQTVLWNVNSASGVVQPYYIVWGRGNDANDYARWKAK
jgi:hypothetical protein